MPDESSSAPGPDGDRVVVTADHVDELGVDRSFQRGDDVGRLAAERAPRREPLVLRLVAEGLVGVEQVLGGAFVAGLRDVLRVEIEERLLVRVCTASRDLTDDTSSTVSAIGANMR